jgi:putative ABC transport system permease protein
VREPILGDLEEVFRRRRRRDSVLRTHVWFWREAAWISASFFADSVRPRTWRTRAPAPAQQLATRGGGGMDLHVDVREAARTFVRRPLFTAAVVGSLAFGIGATTAIFSVFNALVLRPLPVRDPGALFQAVHRGDAGTFDSSTQALHEYVTTHATTIEGALQVGASDVTVVIDGIAESLAGQSVSAGFYDVLGVDALIGTVFQRRTSASGAIERPAVISHRYWQRRFGGDAGVLGRTITIDRRPYTIVGVTRPAFSGLEVGRPVDVTIPLDEPEERLFWQSKALLVRLRSGVTRETARLELDRLLQQYLEADKRMSARTRTQAFRALDLQPAGSGIAGLRDRYLRPLTAVLAIVSALLLLACANLAGLFLARTAARQRDFAVCLALGASRGRLARQLVAESLLLSLLGGGLGLVVAWWGVELLLGLVPDLGASGDLRAGPDATVLLFAFLASAITGVCIGAAPAILAARADLRDALAAGSRTVVVAGGAFRTLVSVQVALSATLVIAALLFTTSLNRLMAEPMGFVAEGVLMLTLNGGGAELEEEQLGALQRQALERLRSLPGVRHATFATIPPLSGNEDGKPIAIPGVMLSTPEDGVVQTNTVGPEFFETFGVPIVRGRGITARDERAAPQVAVVSESMARAYFPGVDPIGRRMDVGRGRTGGQIEIVGIARDARYRDLRTPAPRMVYVPASQRGVEETVVFALRTDGNPAEWAAAAQRELRALAPGIPATAVMTLVGERNRRLVNERLLAAISSGFGVLALVLAGIGVYGVVACAVAGRTAEIGLRLALGASRGALVWLILRGTLTLVVLAAMVGGGVAFLGRSLLATFLFGIAPAAPWVYSGALALLVAIALIAAIVPARRALRIDPVDTLRRV